MARKKKVDTGPSLDEILEMAHNEYSNMCSDILTQYPEDEHEQLRNDLYKQAGEDITRRYSEEFPIFAKAYGPKPPVSKTQFKKIQGNIGLDIEAKKYD